MIGDHPLRAADLGQANLRFRMRTRSIFLQLVEAFGEPSACRVLRRARRIARRAVGELVGQPERVGRAGVGTDLKEEREE